MIYMTELFYWQDQRFPFQKAFLVTARAVAQWCTYYQAKLLAPARRYQGPIENQGILPSEPVKKYLLSQNSLNGFLPILRLMSYSACSWIISPCSKPTEWLNLTITMTPAVGYLILPKLSMPFFNIPGAKMAYPSTCSIRNKKQSVCHILGMV